jgi:hypothetical protein
VYTHAFSVGAPNQLAGQAIFTVAAVDVRIDSDALTRPESCDVGADVVDLTDGFVPWSERIYADVGPVVQVHVSATYAGLVDLDPHVQWPDLRHRHVSDGEVAGCCVTDGFHDPAIVMIRSARGLLRAMRTALA